MYGRQVGNYCLIVLLYYVTFIYLIKGKGSVSTQQTRFILQSSNIWALGALRLSKLLKICSFRVRRAAQSDVYGTLIKRSRTMNAQ